MPPDSRHLGHDDPDSIQWPSPIVLVLDNEEDSRNALVADLQALGRTAKGVSTILEMLVWLQACDVKVEMVAVVSTFVERHGPGVFEFLVDVHPAVRRSLVCPQATTTLSETGLTR